MDEEDPLKRQFDWTLVQAAELESQDQFVSAYGLLQDFAEQHATEDTDGWLFNAVRFQQGIILRMAGELTGALRRHRQVQPRPGDRFFYLTNSHSIARILDELGEPQQALAELRSSLDSVLGPPGLYDLGNLLLYADLSERLGEDLPKPFLEAVQKVVQLWGVPLGDDELGDRRKVAAALRAADEARPRFHRTDSK